jgi:hypothetical protein
MAENDIAAQHGDGNYPEELVCLYCGESEDTLCKWHIATVRDGG